jgi:hypothetical protein
VYQWLTPITGCDKERYHKGKLAFLKGLFFIGWTNAISAPMHIGAVDPVLNWEYVRSYWLRTADDGVVLDICHNILMVLYKLAVMKNEPTYAPSGVPGC